MPENSLDKSQTVESQVTRQIVDVEYTVAHSNASNQNAEFESIIDLLECERTERDYEWMSDIFLPEFPAHMLTQSSLDAAQYFQNREFVDVYLEDGSEEARTRADAAKELINRTLNQRHMSYFQKYIRARLINNLNGVVYARCWWEKELEPFVDEVVELDGNNELVTKPVVKTRAIRDKFNFDILDPRNVFTDNVYSYSIQDKSWIIIRFERTLAALEADADVMGYENLDKLKNTPAPRETQTSMETYNRDDSEMKIAGALKGTFDVLERHGLFWAIRTPEGIKPGIDGSGEKIDKAELIETIITVVVSGAQRILIRFQEQPYRDAHGKAFRPIIRGTCYIHPTKDLGLGDGKFSRELQIAINDTFNISNDRVMLATLPTLKAKKYAIEDTSEIYFEPQHVIPLEDPTNDLVEFKIEDNVTGALQQINLLIGQMQQANAIYPPTMGNTPKKASTTATAIASAESRTNTRYYYKSLTFEHTFLSELYWMILQMTSQYAHPDTGLQLMGEKVYDFDPRSEYFYKPISQAIETEHAKNTKRKEIIQMLSFVAQVPNPNTPKLINLLMRRYFELSGDEAETFVNALLDENAPPPQEGGVAATPNQGVPASNQTGVPMSNIEQGVRGV